MTCSILYELLIYIKKTIGCVMTFMMNTLYKHS